MSLPAYVRRRYSPGELAIWPKHLTTTVPYSVRHKGTVVAGPYNERADAVQAKQDLVAGRVVAAAD